jgi:hypothetical protein
MPNAQIRMTNEFPMSNDQQTSSTLDIEKFGFDLTLGFGHLTLNIRYWFCP